MAVQIINQMPDAEVHHGDPVEELIRELNDSRAPGFLRTRLGGRAGFALLTLAVHVVAALGFMQMQYRERVREEPEPIMASLIDAPDEQPPPPQYSPPPISLAYSLPTPQEVTFETEAITTEAPVSTASPGIGQAAAPPMVASVEYIRAAPPVYPKESQRLHEYGTVVLRVLVDASGRPAQIQVEHSSGYARLDTAAREAVEKFLFRPYEVNGVAQAAQVLIPIGFDRRAS